MSVGSILTRCRFACVTVSQVRCTAGLACTQRLGPGLENMPGELEVANISPHHTIVCRLEHDGRKLEEGSMMYIQVTKIASPSHPTHGAARL